MFNTGDFSSFLYDNGATMVGFADLSRVVTDELKYGVSIAIKIPTEIIASIHDGPNRAYFNTYHDLNSRLNALAKKAAGYLEERGYAAFAQTTDVVKQYGVCRTKMPHKTVAVNAGLGWIGKSALLVTKEYGSACGTCLICTEACPAKAISGRLWSPDLDRDEFFSPLPCQKKARELTKERVHEEATICGKCIEVCPYTQKYLAVNK